MLIQRIIGAAIIVVVVALPLFFGGLAFLALVLLVSALGVLELGNMFRRLGHRPLYVASIGLTAIIVLDAFLRLGLVGWGIVAGVLGPLAWYLFKSPDFGRAAIDWTVTVVGPFYLGWPLAHFVLLRELPNGLVWAAVALLGTWAADTGAYFAGRAFGHRKLYPRVSPGKTWEGVGGGAVASAVVLATLLFYATGLGMAVAPVVGVPLWVHGVALGLLVTGAAVLGDLAESFLKRGTGVKDASSLIPGHGGLLDRLDSLVFSAPVVYYYIVWLRLF